MVGLYLRDDCSVRESLELVRIAERRGFDAVWQASPRLSRDATLPLAVFASQTSRIRLGAGAINIATRHVGVLASTAITLNELAPERIMVALTAGWRPLADSLGLDLRKPLIRMRETVEALRALLADRAVTYGGEFVHLERASLDARTAVSLPIYIAAMAPRMLQLAGEIADGVLLNYMVSERYLDEALDHLSIGAGRAGRSLDDLDRPQLVMCSVDSDPSSALATSRKLLVKYFADDPEVMKHRGIEATTVDEIASEISTYLRRHPNAQLEDAAELLPEDVVRSLTVTGSVDECRSRVHALCAGRATYPVLYPLGDPRAVINAFATRVTDTAASDFGAENRTAPLPDQDGARGASHAAKGHG